MPWASLTGTTDVILHLPLSENLTLAAETDIYTFDHYILT